MAYLRKMRAEQMAHLLGSTDLSIAAIARSVGWIDPNHASRCFHTNYGISPTELGPSRAAGARPAIALSRGRRTSLHMCDRYPPGNGAL